MRSKLFFLLAIVMGLITTSLFYHYMKDVKTEAVASERTQEVVVAKATIPKNKMISSDLLQVVTLPEAAIHPNTVTSINEVIGHYALSEIETGEAILSHRIGTEREENHMVSRKIANGYRAVSVGVNFVQSVSNMIFPNDYVDVIVSELVRVGDEKIVVTEMILERVKVLAIGKTMLEPTELEQMVEYTSVTLELNNQDSVKLVNASERGQVQLILHSRILPN